jgi:DNA-nicking Smr family endonuclease
VKKRADLPGTPGKSSASDADLFAREMADVVRLKPDTRGRVRSAPVLNRPPQPAPPSDRRGDDGESDEAFAAAGVDRREIRKLKRGEYVAADRRDLHGMTAAEAGPAVRQFVENSRQRQHRCVCIVHGRGLHSEGNVAVLKSSVRECLRTNRSVLAYADAPRADGGAGAVYVLLRK